jgi:lactoylglutathione lyase
MSNASFVFDHVHLVSKDPKSTAAWYAEKLGGKVVNSSEVRGAPSIVVAFKGATIIVRGQRTREQVDEKKGILWGTDHFGFRVDGDFDGFCEDLKKNGVTFSIDPVDFGPTLRIAFIDAPDGVSIELLQRKGQ